MTSQMRCCIKLANNSQPHKLTDAKCTSSASVSSFAAGVNCLFFSSDAKWYARHASPTRSGGTQSEKNEKEIEKKKMDQVRELSNERSQAKPTTALLPVRDACVARIAASET